MRILGRKGVLVLNLVATMPHVEEIEIAIATVLAMTNFNPGNRYSHFDTSIDKVAGCGIAAPIASKVAATAGLFAKLGVVLVLRKFWIFIAIAVGAFITRLFRRAKPRELPASP